MTDNAIKSIVIVGGGTAGWMTAASLASFLEGSDTAITLIESTEVGTVGVGEATLPTIRGFNHALGIDEVDFIRGTKATFKLGIEFVDWKSEGESFFHPFAGYGARLGGIDFHHVWRRMQESSAAAPLCEYSLPTRLARLGRFAQPRSNPVPLAEYAYAFHFDAVLYAKYLREYACKRDVVRVDSKVVDVALNAESGFIDAVVLEDNCRVTGDLFIDCTGFRALLIDGALQSDYHDWSKWLPCDSAVALPCKYADEMLPYTRSIAREAGWQWRIPLQHRVGNGYVYSSNFLSDDEAVDRLLDRIEGDPLAEPRLLKFRAGARDRFWIKNCVAIGLSSGFVEPLESTSIALIQGAISKLLLFFPDRSFAPDPIAEANRQHSIEFERIRDFLILHYSESQRDDSEFWQYTRTMSVPDDLRQKISLFRDRGYFVNFEGESFENSSWLSIYDGLGIRAERYDRRVDRLPADQLARGVREMRETIRGAAECAPLHEVFVARHCKAPGYAR